MKCQIQVISWCLFNLHILVLLSKLICVIVGNVQRNTINYNMQCAITSFKAVQNKILFSEIDIYEGGETT